MAGADEAAAVRREEELARLERAVAELGRQVEALRETADAARRGEADMLARLGAIEAAQAEHARNLREAVEAGTAAVTERIRSSGVNEYRQREAMETLSRLLGLAHPLPPTRMGAASPDFLLHVCQLVMKRRPGLVVELGAGASTIAIAAALRLNGEGVLHSLEHVPDYGAGVAEMLARQGLDGIARLHIVPLEPWTPPARSRLGQEWLWYAAPDDLGAEAPIDLLIVDGPPQSGQKTPRNRYPAVPHFRPRMSPGCIVLVDDANRADERAICRAWRAEWNMTLDFLRPFEKGLAMLTPLD